MRLGWALVAACLLVAGCSDNGGNVPPPSEPEIDYGVEATKTTGVIRGVVIDEAIRPLTNVTVTLLSANKTVVTKSDGAFGFDGLDPGTYFVQANKFGFEAVQTSVDVVAGNSQPPITKMTLKAVQSLQPYVEPFSSTAFITCGAAIVATSVGCNTFTFVGETIGDKVYFQFEFTTLPWWTQGELVWQQTQPAGGGMIWEIVDPNYPGSPQPHTGYRETAPSPALAYINTTLLEENQDWVLGEGNGVLYRIFAGPHPSCTGVGFGCGVTVQQKMELYVHNFYNFAPREGWRFTVDGDPVLPP